MATTTHLSTDPNLQLLTMHDLSQRPDLLHDLVAFINLAYARPDKSETLPRFSHPQTLLDENGSDGLCAIIISQSTIIATASFRKWRPEPCGQVDELFKVNTPP